MSLLFLEPGQSLTEFAARRRSFCVQLMQTCVA